MLPLQSERRRHERLRFRGEVTLAWKGPDGDRLSLKGNCVDMSLLGMSIEVPQILAAGTPVAVFGLSDKPQPAIVRHCRAYGPWHRIGIRFPRPIMIKEPAEKAS